MYLPIGAAAKLSLASKHLCSKQPNYFWYSKYNVPKGFRSTRYDVPASEVGALIGRYFTNKSGVLALADSSTITIQMTVVGPYVRVQNDAGQEVSLQMSIASAKPQLLIVETMNRRCTADYVYCVRNRQGKARSFAPNMRHLDEQLRATVNIDGECTT